MFSASADLPGQLFVHVYRCSAWVGVCWENMLGLASGWKGGKRGASLRLPHSATSTSIYMRLLHTCPKRHGGSPWTSLHLSSSTLQGLPLHRLWIKAVNHKRSVSEEYKSENSILLNTYVSSLSDWLSFALYSLNYSCLLTLDFIFFFMNLRRLDPLWEIICFAFLGFLHSLHPVVSLIELSYWNCCLMHLFLPSSLYQAFCQLSLEVV